MTQSKHVSFHRLSKQNKRIVYTFVEYSPLLDSCNMTIDDWATIGKDIEVLGVVISHSNTNHNPDFNHMHKQMHYDTT